MEPNAPPAELYDFLYKDISRLSSYYAQIFQGRLAALEETDSTQDASEENAKVSIKLVEGALKTNSQVQTSIKRVIDPHDLATADVLSYLVENGRINPNLQESSHGELVLIKGTIVFIDQLMLEGALIAYEEEIKQYKKRPKKEIDPTVLAHQEMGVKLFAKIRLPSAFLIHTDDGQLVGGIIKEAGMDEPIISYYVKHGTHGLSNVYLVAIKEQSTSAFTMPADQMFGVAQIVAEAFSQFVFPSSSCKVTPIAIFRKL
jgi:hypothetical protein